MTRKVYHRAKHIATDGSGNVSALCFKKPRPIDLKKAMWTTRDDAVTCPACIKAISDRQAGCTVDEVTQ